MIQLENNHNIMLMLISGWYDPNDIDSSVEFTGIYIHNSSGQSLL